MKRIVNIASVLLLACVAFISCEREGRPVVQEESRPIVFAVDGEWPEITKIPIYDAETIKETGFRVWGTWHQDSEDHASYTYDAEVFGEDGTLVSLKEGSELLLPEQDAMWHRGYYCFAAVFPSGLAGVQVSTFETTSAGEHFANTLTLDFSEDGFDLAETQTDLMYAFSNIDNSDADATTVRLDFSHAFASLDIRITHNGAKIRSVSLYGIHDRITGHLQLNDSDNGNLTELLLNASVSTENAPYYYAQFDDGQDYVDETITIVDDLLVFPETLSINTSLAIKFELQYSGKNEVLYARVTEGEWTPGSTNVYVIEVDTSKFDTTE